jgi:hypothetical protein
MLPRNLSGDEKTSCPGLKVADTWRFKKEDIDSWIERQKMPDRAGEEGQCVVV